MQMNEKDFKILELAFLDSKSHLYISFLLFIVLEIFAKYYILQEHEDITLLEKYILYLLPFSFLIFYLVNYMSIIRDLLNKEKIIYIGNCKIVEYTDEVSTFTLCLENSQRIRLAGFNKKNYLGVFSDEKQLFELHFSKWSKTILFCKKLEN